MVHGPLTEARPETAAGGRGHARRGQPRGSHRPPARCRHQSRLGRATADADLELGTTGMSKITEHNRGDLTAVLDAGVPFATAQAQFAQAGQMLALDPPLGAGGAATIGGVVATADSGPLRHRYGGPRDLVIGVTVALSDGTIAKSGGKVIKNVAGYDLAKLYAGSFGTLGLILSVSVRLHPLHDGGTTALGAAADPDTLGAAALAMAALPLEFEAIDVAWRGGRGGILMRCAGSEHARRAGAGRPSADRARPRVGRHADRGRRRTVGAPARRPAQPRQAALVRVTAPPVELRCRAACHRRGGRHPGRPRRAGHQLRGARLRSGRRAARGVAGARRCPACSTPRRRSAPSRACGARPRSGR